MTQTIEDLEKLIRNPNWKKIYLDSRYPTEDEFNKRSKMSHIMACGHACETEETWIVYAGRRMRLVDYYVEKQEFKKKIQKLDENNILLQPDHIIEERNKIHEALEIGTLVTARSRNKGGFFPGKIIGKNEDNTYQVEFPSFIDKKTGLVLKRDNAPVDSIMIGHWPAPELFWNRPYDEDKGVPYNYKIPWRKDWQRENPSTKERYTAKITFQYSPNPTPVLPMHEQIDVTDEHLRYNGKNWNYLEYTLESKKNVIMAKPGVLLKTVTGTPFATPPRYVPHVARGVGGFPRPPPPYSPMVVDAVPDGSSANWWKTLNVKPVRRRATRRYAQRLSTGGKRTRKRKSKKRRARKHKKRRKSKKRKSRRRK